MPFLSMIVMIKGIYLITGLLNYSSVEARLFRRMLIVLRSPRHCLALSGGRWLAGCADQRFVRTATGKKTGKEKEGNVVQPSKDACLARVPRSASPVPSPSLPPAPAAPLRECPLSAHDRAGH